LRVPLALVVYQSSSNSVVDVGLPSDNFKVCNIVVLFVPVFMVYLQAVNRTDERSGYKAMGKKQSPNVTFIQIDREIPLFMLTLRQNSPRDDSSTFANSAHPTETADFITSLISAY
jgi:hypothetical protein